MITIIFWVMGLFCPNPTHTAADHGSCTQLHVTTSSNSEGDTGGETGGLPTPPPPPPPPPPGN